MDPFYYSNYDYDYANLTAAMGVWYLICLAIAVLGIIALWKIFVKAGQEGWAAIIPLYNTYVLYKISWGNGWLFLLLLIPFVNIVIHIISMVKLSKSFGQGSGFACGLIFLYMIFLLILAFKNDIHYIGPNGGEPPSAGGYGGYNNPYARDYTRNQGYDNYQSTSSQYTQTSAQNPNYHYQRNEPQGGVFCHVCGTRIEDEAKFCAGCGRELNK